MKRITTYILAVAAMFAASCDNNIPEIGTINNALVEQVVFDDVLSAGVEIMVGSTFSIPEHVSALPIDATNTAQVYESSNPAIADVSGTGVITAKQIGECTITVYIGTDGICAEFPLTVVRVPYINISSLRFTVSETEYEASEGTVNMKSLLYVGSTSDTEDATEPVLFSSSNESVATIDANGVLTIHKLGETTVTASAEVSAVAPATVNVKFYKWIEYERFPGDSEGKAREIMGTSLTEWDAMPHIDGGWEIEEFGHLEKAGQTWNAGTGQRNCYRYACLDGRRIVARAGGTANNLPTATNGTAFCWSRPGGNDNAKENASAYFVVDMMKSQIVNYFRLVNISNNKDDHGVFVTKVSEIQGSNDNSSWTTIAENVEDFNTRTGDVYMLETDKALFANDVPYRYIKFIFKKNDHCYGFYKDDGTSDRTGRTIQIAELYMGCKAYNE